MISFALLILRTQIRGIACLRIYPKIVEKKYNASIWALSTKIYSQHLKVVLCAPEKPTRVHLCFTIQPKP